MASNSVKPDGREAQGNAEPSPPWGEGVETRRRPPVGPPAHGEGIVQGAQKRAQTGILWSLVQVQHGLPPHPARRRPQRGAVERYAEQKTSRVGKPTGRQRSCLKLSVNTKTCLGEALSVPSIVTSGCRTGRGTVRDRGRCRVQGQKLVPAAGPKRTVGPWRTAGKLLSGMAKPPSTPNCRPTTAAHASGYESSALTN